MSVTALPRAHEPGGRQTPAETLRQDAMFSDSASKPLRAVFLNYLLDCLPAAVLEIDGESVDKHCRTRMATFKRPRRLVYPRVASHQRQTAAPGGQPGRRWGQRADVAVD